MAHFDIFVRMKDVDVLGGEEDGTSDLQVQSSRRLMPTPLFYDDRHSSVRCFASDGLFTFQLVL